MDWLWIFGFALLVVSKEVWEQLMKSNGWNPVELRDTRYNQIIHMVSSAKGAEDFYTLQVSVSELAISI